MSYHVARNGMHLRGPTRFSKDIGHGLTFKVLTDNTRKIINCSKVRLAKTGENNLCLDKVPERIYIHSGLDEETGEVKLLTVGLDTDSFSVAFDNEYDISKEA
jgi:hypothetical protein